MPPLTDRNEIRARLERDRPWAAFSLADLDPPHDRHAKWFGLHDGRALLLVYRGFDPPITVCHGDPDECAILLGEPDVRRATSSAYLNVTHDQFPAAARHFTSFESKTMLRMRLTEATVVTAPPSGVTRLDASDLDALRRLYADEPPAFFLPTQLDDGVYFGIHEGRDLVAVAGTHVVSPAASVAALGNIYTRQDRRGRGLAAAVTSAVVGELVQRGMRTIVLNIVSSNEVAERLYERLGFRVDRPYYEGVARR